ncbi:hypothetical protein SEPCBS119000_004408 [Sporothrix epigloea]|uniref:Uncharacterized protein n=1 Tax=Sporothrix epigloea TaxID=1892477 RepID=A0ABP0DUV8_9PEZI
MKAALISLLGLTAFVTANNKAWSSLEDEDCSDEPYSGTIIVSAPSATEASQSDSVDLITSTIFSTTVSSIVSCHPTINSCPAESTALTTVVVAVRTTICPVTTAAASSSLPASTTPLPAVTSAAASSSAALSGSSKSVTSAAAEALSNSASNAASRAVSSKSFSSPAASETLLPTSSSITAVTPPYPAFSSEFLSYPATLAPDASAASSKSWAAPYPGNTTLSSAASALKTLTLSASQAVVTAGASYNGVDAACVAAAVLVIAAFV